MVFKERRKLLIGVAATLALTLTIALATAPKYQASASLLVLLGPEYAFRPDAGGAGVVNASLTREEFLRSEIEILDSDNLHQAVLRKLGLGYVYPKYLEGPGLFGTIRQGLSALLADVAGLFGATAAPKGPVDPVMLATPEFDVNFDSEALKAGSNIELTFQHKNPQVAADVLNTLISLYLERRLQLYADDQSTVIGEQVKALRQQLEAIDQQIASFKSANFAYNYEAQRDILLHQKGQLQADAESADSIAAQTAQRLSVVGASLRTTPTDEVQQTSKQFDAHGSDLRAQLGNLYKQEAEQRAKYNDGSWQVRDIQRQIAAIESRLKSATHDNATSEVRMGRNTNFDELEMERVHAESDMRAAAARIQADRRQMAEIDGELAVLNDKETSLGRLERQRSLVESNYRDLAKQLDDRRVLEEVEQRKAENVRVIQPAVPPLSPRPIRAMILLAGTILSVIVAGILLFVSELTRNSYISPEQIERDLGIAVLVSVPERSIFAREARLLGASSHLAGAS